MNRIFALFYTILPGANRAIFFLIASHTLTDINFANFSVTYSLAIVISMVGGTGIGTLILKDNVSLDVINLIKSSIIAMGISIPILFIIYLYNYLIINPILLFFLSFALTINQIYRNEIILKKKFMHGTLYETSVLVTCSISLIIFTEDNVLYSMSFLYIMLTVVLKYLESSKASSKRYNLSQASYISYSNLVSSGILFFFPSMTLVLTTPNTTKVVSLLVSIIGIVSVFPRSIFNYKLFEVKNYLFAKDEVKFKEYINFFRKVTSVLICLSTIFALFYVSVVANIGMENKFNYVFILVLLISLYIYIGQLFIPETTLVNMIGYEKYSLLLNVINFLFFIFTYFILKLIRVNGDFLPVYILSASVIFGYLIRSMLINIKIKGYFKNESSLF